MSKPRKTLSGWALADLSEQPKSLRSPQERNLLQFSPFVGLEEGPPSTKGRFRRVQTAISGSNRPGLLTNLTSRQVSQMSSSDSGEGGGPFSPSDQNHLPLPIDGEHRPGVLDSDSESSSKEDSAADADSDGNGGLSNLLTVNLDQATLRGKPSSLGPGRRTEISEAGQGSDMEPSQISAHSKAGSSEHDSAYSMAGAGAEASGSGNTVRRRVTAALTRTLSQEGNVIRKISGILSRPKTASPKGSQPVPKVDANDRTGGRDAKLEQGIPARKASLLGTLGLPTRKRSFMRDPKRRAERIKSADLESWTEKNAECDVGGGMTDKGNGPLPDKDTEKMEQRIPERKASLLRSLGLPTRKRSFMRSPKKRAERVKSADFELWTRKNAECEVGRGGLDKGNGPLSEKDTTITAAITGFRDDLVGDDEVTTAEDDLAKRAMQIERFLNSVSFL